MRPRAVPALVGLLLASGMAGAQETGTPWPLAYTDPAAERGRAADLVLPMPCGAAMAFQKVTVPVSAEDPLDDRRVRLGQSLDRTGYSDYLRPAFLRGAFRDPSAGTTHYYIARYELTAGQYRALQGDCSLPNRRDRLAKGGLSWFEAVRLAQDYTSWLYRNAPGTLPREDRAKGFLRLPTEDEWEFATRGGARIDATDFPALTFFGEGDMRDYAWHQAPGSARGKVGPVGLRGANPLGLYDVYGNVEELMLEPYRLNAIGRAHGQPGGVVTRGGSALSTSDQIYSAQRTEYPPFDPATGDPMAAPTFGLRLVISAHVVASDQRLNEIRDRWGELAGAQSSAQDTAGDPLAQLSALIEAEIDPRRQQTLTDLQLAYRRADDRVQTALQQAARSTLLAGAVFVEALIENDLQIKSKRGYLQNFAALQSAGNTSAMFDRQVQVHVRRIGEMRRLQSTYLLSYRAALETLHSDISRAERDAAYAVLREELLLTERARLLDMLERFWADLATYAERPDIEPQALLRVALE